MGVVASFASVANYLSTALVQCPAIARADTTELRCAAGISTLVGGISGLGVASSQIVHACPNGTKGDPEGPPVGPTLIGAKVNDKSSRATCAIDIAFSLLMLTRA